MARGGKPQISWGDDIVKVLKMLDNAAKKGKRTQIKTTSARIVKQMEKQGKKYAAKGVKTKAANIEQQFKDDVLASKRAAQEAVRKRQERTLRATRLGEAAEEKGSKIVRGREVPMSQKKAKEAALQGKRAGAQRKKGNAARRAEQNNLRRMANDRTLPASTRLKARRRLNKHIDDHGYFP